MAKKDFTANRLLTHNHPKSPIAEAYRTLRTNLGFASVDHPARLILISSPNPQDGKSSVAANLAVVLAQAGNRTILIDCDLRKPIQHNIFELDNRRGVTNCLVQKLAVEEAAQKCEVENLTILTSGPLPPNPAELLASDRARALWNQLLAEYDYVLIDAPPILAVTDASILASQVDGVLLVISSGSTRTDVARTAKEQLLKANARIIGVVLNKLKMNSKEYQYYYYYYSSSNGNGSRRLQL